MENIGKYAVSGVIGSGGFGTVHLGTDPDSGELVAIKVLDWPEEHWRRQMFRDEVAALLSINHPNVVRVRDVIDTPELAALVTDFVEGSSLREVLRRTGPLDGPQCLSVLRGALNGLAAVHAAGLVHGDLKPENILLDATGTSRLIDFGLAAPPRGLSGPDTWIGTPAYLAPEVVLGHHVDHRSDIYAAAVTLFELLCGRPPYAGPDPVMTAMLHVQSPIPDPQRINPDINGALSALCRKDLAKDPTERHQHTPALLTSLDSAATQAYGAAWAGAGAGLGSLVATTLATLSGGGAAGGAVAGAAGGAVAGAAGIGLLGAAPVSGPLAGAGATALSAIGAGGTGVAAATGASGAAGAVGVGAASAGGSAGASAAGAAGAASAGSAAGAAGVGATAVGAAGAGAGGGGVIGGAGAAAAGAGGFGFKGAIAGVVAASVIAAGGALWWARGDAPESPTDRSGTSQTPDGSGPAAMTPASTPRRHDRPLVIVLDTSGSMDDSDANGVRKLDGAKAALSDAIRQQRPGALVGLWTYPGTGPSDDGCGGGGFAIDVQKLDQGSMIRTISGLEAGGGTPTAEALEGAVEQLKDQGYDGATLLLISDGESGCGDPCEAAHQIRSQGFDLTVQAAGFDITDGGQSELDCVAGASGGEVYEAADATVLSEVVTTATAARLTTAVRGVPTTVAAGTSTRVTVDVTNDSAIDVDNARISIGFGGAENNGVVAAPLPPLVGLGNLPAGSSTRHSWIVSYGSSGKLGDAPYAISVWGSNSEPTTTTGTVTVVAPREGIGEADSTIGDLDGQRFAMMGDGFAAGQGAASAQEDGCRRSSDTYLASLAEPDDVLVLACAGATSIDHGTRSSSTVSNDQVDALRDAQSQEPVAAAFLSAGAEDVALTQLIHSCLAAKDCGADPAFTSQAQRIIASVGPALRATYRDVYTALNEDDAVKKRGELAPLYVVAYPQLFPEAQRATAFCPAGTSGAAVWANDLVASLNDRIERAVRRARSDGFHVQFVNATQEAFLPDNAACPRPGATSFVHPVDENGADTLYPTTEGYRAQTNAILAWSDENSRDLPDGVTAWQPGDRTDRPARDYSRTWLGRALLLPLPGPGAVAFDARSATFDTSSTDVRAGHGLEIAVEHAAPGTSVTVALEPTGEVLGLLPVGKDGRARGTVIVPRTAGAGAHHIVLLAVSDDGRARSAALPTDVARAVPLWLMPLVVLTLICAAGARLLRRRHRTTSGAASSEHAVPLYEES